jgi:hypothetical protein
MARKNSPTAAARPAPFTPEQVASLVAGQANTAEVGKLLAAHRQPRLPSPVVTRRTKTSAAPIPLSAADLRELATGRVPESVETRLERFVPTQRARTKPRRPGGARPSRRPA